MKLYLSVLLLIFLSGCFHETSLINNYGQSIVKVPNQTETTDALNSTKNANKPYVTLSNKDINYTCLLYTSPSPRDRTRSRMPSSA